MKSTLSILILLFAGITMKGQTWDSLIIENLKVKVQKMISFNIMNSEGYRLYRNDVHAVYPHNATDKSIKYTLMNHGDLLDVDIVPLSLPIMPDTNYLYFSIIINVNSKKNKEIIRNTGVQHMFFLNTRRFIATVNLSRPTEFSLINLNLADSFTCFSLSKIFNKYQSQGFNKDNVYSYLFFEFFSQGLDKLAYEKEDNSYLYFIGEFEDGSIRQLCFDKINPKNYYRTKQLIIKP